MPFVVDKFKSKNGASVSEEFALFNWIQETTVYCQPDRSILDEIDLWHSVWTRL